MADDFIARAEAQVAAYVASHPGHAIDDRQPDYRGGTNRCVFGSRRGEPVVYKAYVGPERWRHELACLRHFAASGLVPRVHDAVPESLVVMSRLGGGDLGAISGAPVGTLQAASLAIGRALAALLAVPPPVAGSGHDPIRDFATIPWRPEPRAAVEHFLAIAWRARDAVPDCRTSFCERSLRAIEAVLPRVADEPRALYHEDISNLRIDARGEVVSFAGFYDLEMCRAGTASLQLGVALALCGPGGLSWPLLRDAFSAAARPVDEEAVLAMGHLYHWIRICRWGWWDGDPRVEHHLRDAIADAPWHLDGMRRQSLTVTGSPG